MRSIDFPIYQRQEDLAEQEEGTMDKLKQELSLVSLSLLLVGFALGKVTILNGLMPFGLSYFAIFLYHKDKTFVNSWRLFFILLGVAGGYVIKLDWWALKYVISLGLIFSLQKYLLRFKIVVYSLLASSIFLVCQLPYFYLEAGLANYISLGAEVGTILLTILLVLKILPESLIFLDNKSKTVKLSISVGLVLFLTIISLVGEEIARINLVRLAIAYLTVITALATKPTIAAAVGVVAGFMYNITHLNALSVAGNYALAGLIAGNFAEQNKLGVTFGFIVSNLLYITFISIPGQVVSLLQEAVIASLILFITPQQVITAVNRLCTGQDRGEKLEDKRLQSFVTERVEQFSEIFNELSTAFSEVLPEDSNEVNDVGIFLDLITDKVCVKCELCSSCWEQSFYTTYQSLFKLLAIAENKGEVLTKDVERVLSINCSHSVKLATAINQFIKMYELNNYWENKLYENERMLLNQLSGMSQVVDDLTEELTISIQAEDELETEVHSILTNKGFDIQQILATNYNNEQLELTIRKKSCSGSHKCEKNIVPLLNSKLDRNFDLVWSECGAQLNKSTCLCRLAPAVKYKLQTGVATASKVDSISGDNFTFFKQRKGQFVSILSDGMGVGSEAFQESKSAVCLLEKMLQAGLNYKLALETINSILGLRSQEDSFATIDLLQVNQLTGEAEFIKVGSVSSFIKRGTEISMVKSTTLPVGILNEIELESNSLQLEDKDLIIMMSDGVLDSEQELTIKEEWVRQLLKNNLIDDPQSLAQYILDKAQNNKDIEDDMTVLVIRVDKC
ncbi:stage II sporulation protein E [Halanaerobaculum tunisiense]